VRGHIAHLNTKSSQYKKNKVYREEIVHLTKQSNLPRWRRTRGASMEVPIIAAAVRVLTSPCGFLLFGEWAASDRGEGRRVPIASHTGGFCQVGPLPRPLASRYPRGRVL
jgi:hypothetical protein